MRREDLFDKIQDRPFKPFRIHLTDGSRLDVVEPGMFILGESTAVLPSVWTKDEEGRKFAKHWRTIDFALIVQFVCPRDEAPCPPIVIPANSVDSAEFTINS